MFTSTRLCWSGTLVPEGVTLFSGALGLLVALPCGLYGVESDLRLYVAPVGPVPWDFTTRRLVPPLGLPANNSVN